MWDLATVVICGWKDCKPPESGFKHPILTGFHLFSTNDYCLLTSVRLMSVRLMPVRRTQQLDPLEYHLLPYVTGQPTMASRFSVKIGPSKVWPRSGPAGGDQLPRPWQCFHIWFSHDFHMGHFWNTTSHNQSQTIITLSRVLLFVTIRCLKDGPVQKSTALSDSARAVRL
jgi:hypothetical protein